MTGPYQSVIGIEKDIIIEKLITQRPVRFEVASGPIQINGLLVDINELTGECRTIERFFSLIDS
jgi:calcineurin-like phosphoesterase